MRFKLRLVNQEDPCGCGIACVAMLAGKTYQEIRAKWLIWSKGDYDALNNRGITGWRLVDFMYWLRVPRRRWAYLADTVHLGRGKTWWWHWVVVSPEGKILSPTFHVRRRFK